MIWFAYLPLWFVVTLSAYLLAPILPLFAKSQWGFSDNANAMATEPRLPDWLSWYQTPDNSLWGDYGWQTKHCPEYKTYWGMVKWLWRNTAYGFIWHGPVSADIHSDAKLVYSGDATISNRPLKPGYFFAKLENPDGSRYWHLYLVMKITDNYCLNVNLGWKLKTYAEDSARLKTEPRAMFAFSPRIASSK